MFGKVISLFVLMSFFVSFIAEADSIHINLDMSDSHVITSYSSSSSLSFTGLDSEDCEENDCSDHANHCSHHCSGLHNIIPVKSHASLKRPEGFSNRADWYYSHHYKTPFLDPSLKPPMHS